MYLHFIYQTNTAPNIFTDTFPTTKIMYYM